MKRQDRVRSFAAAIIVYSMNALQAQISPMKDNFISFNIKFSAASLRRCSLYYEAFGPAVALKQRCLQDIVAIRQLVDRLETLEEISMVKEEISLLKTIDIHSIKKL
jgi:hypothetical protein